MNFYFFFIDDDMNYEKKFRILPNSIVNGKNDLTKNVIDITGDEKPVFDINFGKHKKYSIDDCIPLAFGDFNADKVIDIFCRNTKGDRIRIMLNDDRSPTSKEQFNINITGIIYDALAADFNGDSKLDLFVLYKEKFDQIGYNGGIFWGDRIKLNVLQPLDYLFESIPTTLDANGDSYVELLGMISTDKKNFKPACVYLKNNTRSTVEILPNIDNFRPSSTQASVDLSHDLVAGKYINYCLLN
ncbi:unnamed protein product [Rotaria sp. Silwood1]|nr:unnamed protein product [Rotaria sp. Silwood1]